MQNWEFGLRPLRAVGSVYEPEVVGAIGAYAAEGRRNGLEDDAKCIGDGV